MEEKDIGLIETLFCRKIMLYHDLLNCLKEEKAALVNIDMDRLWEISREKETLCNKIQSAKQKLAATIYPTGDQAELRLNRVMSAIPRPWRAKFQTLCLRLVDLKGEVDFFRKENMVVINDSLRFLDEMISTITGKRKSPQMYDANCRMSSTANCMLLSREV